MCLKPISIPNPNFQKVSYASEFGQGVEIPRHLLPSSRFIKVSCGKCTECRQSYYNSILQRALVEARSSYMYFVTLTYDNKHLPILKLPNGEDVYYFDYSHIQNMFKRFRRHNHLDRDFRYLCVNEYGDKYSRPHAHLLIFVARLDNDTDSTPYFIESTLYKYLKVYFSINVGTRKEPIYEPLFTLRTRGKYTNYFVKYVDPMDQHDYNPHTVDQLFTKTIRYLISYVNSGSHFDATIESILSTCDDTYLVKKLRIVLRSRVRYSKGFGCGFVNGSKDYLPIISTRCSGKTLYHSQNFYNLPDSFSDYIDAYDNLDELNNFLTFSTFSLYKTFDDYLSSLTASDFHILSVLSIYFPHYIDTIYKRYYAPIFEATVTYFFSFLHPVIYVQNRVLSHNPINSPTFDYLRNNVESALSQKIPFLSFLNETDGTYTALCPFYKKRITTINDIQSLYNFCNFSNYEDWQSNFIEYKNLSKVAKNVGNISKHSENSEKILPFQKKYLHLPQALSGIALFNKIFN